MTYRLLEKFDDKDIPAILSVYMQPTISQFISIDNENYWIYITDTDCVYFYKVYKDNILVGTMHLELADGILYMSVVVFPEYQRQGYATIMLKDVQSGKFGLDFNKIEVSIDEKNKASIELFESVGFICTGKDEELFKYEYSKG